jgi:WD40 repeat protein
MDIYEDYLFFNDEINHKNSIYIYDIKNKKLIYQYKNLKGKISSMFIEDHYLFALCSDGYIYKWDINKVLLK